MILSSPGIIWTNPISDSTTLVTAIPSITAGTSTNHYYWFNCLVIHSKELVYATGQEISSATNALGLSDVDSNPDGSIQSVWRNRWFIRWQCDRSKWNRGDEDDHDPQEIAVAHIFDLALWRKN